MKIQRLTNEAQRKDFNARALHPLQAWEWGEFRKDTGVKVERYGVIDENGKVAEPIQVTIHRIPKTPWTVGYMPKGYFPTQAQVEILREIGKRHNSIFIKVEPKVLASEIKDSDRKLLKASGFVSGRPLFTKYNFVLDIDKPEEELLSNMKSKTRYNLRLAERKGVRVEIDNSTETFEEYLKLTKETTERQGFYAHTEKYHRQMWNCLRTSGIAHLVRAVYQGKILTTWVLFTFNNTLYYPYGASSREHREVMASNLVMWEAIRFGKDQGCKQFDLWGALGPDPDEKDPWYGFHRFKEGYGAEHIEFMGTYDLVIQPLLYWPYRAAESIRWAILRMLKR